MYKGEYGIPLPSYCILKRGILKNNVFSAIRYHIASPDDLDSILRLLLQLATYHIEVLPLSSGRSGAISGEVRRVSSARSIYFAECLSRSHYTQARHSTVHRDVSYHATAPYTIA